MRFEHHWFTYMVVVPRESEATSLEDLAGLTWAIPAFNSVTGYTYASATFAQAGVEPGAIRETGGHLHAILALANGEADFATAFFSPPLMEPPWQYGDDPEPFEPSDCAISNVNQILCDGVRVMDARRMIADVAPDVVERLRILTIGPQVPNEAVAFSSGVPSELRQEILDALIAFGESESCVRSLCELYGWEGFERVADSLYDAVREMVDVLDYSEQQMLGE
jgi:phosphonate transport system substrate-binding protein